MPISNRNVTIKSIFAASANTTIPSPPVVGTSYRNETVTTQEIAAGWPYKEIVDSGKFNEAMYEYTTICKLLEEYGFLPWSPYTDYPAQGCAMGTDGNVYQAKVATGPNTTAVDPVTDTSHNTWDLFYYSDFTANRAIISNAGGKLTASGVTSSELGYLSGVTSAIQAQINAKAADNVVVHLAGAETITGDKTFSGHVKLTERTDYPDSGLLISNNYPNYAISIQDTSCTKGTAPSSRKFSSIGFYGTKKDGYNDRLGLLECVYETNKDVIVRLRAYLANSSSDTTGSTLEVIYPASGNPYTKAPASDVNNSIVTTVNKTKAQNGYFKLGNGLIVQWGFSQASGTVVTVTLPTAFTTNNYSVVLTVNQNSANELFVQAKNSTSFTWNRYGGIGNNAVYWIAIGY